MPTVRSNGLLTVRIPRVVRDVLAPGGLEARLVNGGIYRQFDGMAGWSEPIAGGGFVPGDRPFGAFSEACKYLGISQTEAVKAKGEWKPTKEDPPIVGDLCFVIEWYREMLRAKRDADISECAYQVGRYAERAYVRSFEPAAKMGKAQRVRAIKVNEENHPPAERRNKIEHYQREVELLCADGSFGYEAALHSIASKHSGLTFRWLKRYMKNPHPRSHK